MQKQTSVPNVQVDPVCAMEVDADHTDITSTYKSHTYYFCAKGCKKAFDSAPEKFIDSTSKKKGWWDRHVDRLKDVHCDRSMECHK